MLINGTSTEPAQQGEHSSKANELWQLFSSFLKIGAFMFGGGYAMLPLLTRELIDRRHWVSEEELLDYFAIAQCTPGVIAVNTASFVGLKRGGVLGASIATFGVIFVPMVLIILIASVLAPFWELPAVAHAFGGIRVAVAALIASAVVRMYKSSIRNVFGMVLCIVAFVLVALLGQSPVLVVALAALAGILAGRWTKQ